MLGDEAITHSRLGAKIFWTRWIGFELSPQLQHENSQVMDLVLMVWSPYFSKQLTVCHDSVCLTNQNVQEFVFDGCQPYFSTID